MCADEFFKRCEMDLKNPSIPGSLDNSVVIKMG
jgi:hypothetical protein